jgi:hypothetical protein
MKRYSFNDLSKLIDFINYIKEFENWKILFCNIKSSSGTILNIKPSVNKNLYRNLKSDINNFLNSNTIIDFEIKFECPDLTKFQFDINNQYFGFYIYAYSNIEETVLTTSEYERVIQWDFSVITQFEEYFIFLYNKWLNQNLIQAGE